MKFTKTALAVAMVSLVAAPVAQADVTLSGYIGIILGSDDSDETDDKFGLASDDSTINVHATHELNNGLTGYGTVRFDGGLTDDAPSSDGIKVGVKGGFGDFRMGDVVNPIAFGQMAGDILTDIRDNVYFNDVEEQAIGYTGTFGPATVGIMWSPERNRDAIGAGVKFGFGGFKFGFGAGTVGDGGASDDLSIASAGASFGFSGVGIGVAYKDFDGVEAISVKGSYGIGAASLAVTYETLTSDSDVDGDNQIRLDVGYALGGGMDVSTRFNIFSDDSDSAGDVTDYRVMLTKSF